MFARAHFTCPTKRTTGIFTLNIRLRSLNMLNLFRYFQVIGERRVAVPTHFFKAVLIERGIDEFELEVYLMPNAPIPDEKPLNDFLVPIDTVERAAGFLIYENLPADKLKKINGRSTGTTIFSLL